MIYKVFCMLLACLSILLLVSCGGEFDWENKLSESIDFPGASPDQKPNSENEQQPTSTVYEECSVKVHTVDAHYRVGDYYSEEMSVINSREELDAYLQKNEVPSQYIYNLNLVCEDYAADYFDNSTLLIYYACSSGCCMPWVSKVENARSDDQEGWISVNIDNHHDSDVHTCDEVNTFYVIEVTDVKEKSVIVNYEDAEKASSCVVYVADQVGEPIAFESLQSAIDMVKAYDYKAFADEYRRSYQHMMKELLNIGYIYDVNADGYQKGADGVTLAPINAARGSEMGITYFFESQGVQYQVTVCDIIDTLYMDNIKDYCFNRFGYTNPESNQITVENEYLQNVFRFCKRKTQNVSYKAMIDTKYYIDVVTDETDLTKVSAFLESISLERVDIV